MKTKTYKEISQELFENDVYYTDSEGYIFYEKPCYKGRCNDDLNVAKYLNKDWIPN